MIRVRIRDKQRGVNHVMIAIDLREIRNLLVRICSGKTIQSSTVQYVGKMNLIGCKSSSFGNFLFQKHDVGRRGSEKCDAVHGNVGFDTLLD